MTAFPEPDITLDVDLRNPGQFFACCGVLELASRLWPGSEANGWREPEGWFEGKQFNVATYAQENTPSIARMVHWLTTTEPVATRLETQIEYDDKVYPVLIMTKIPLLIDWWLDGAGSTEASRLKFWAAHQHPLQIIDELRQGFGEMVTLAGDSDYRRLLAMKTPMTTRFGADHVAAWRARDVGFAPNEHPHLKRTLTSPATELLAAIGLQGFRPRSHPRKRRMYIYSVWPSPLPAIVARVMVSNSLEVRGQDFEFEIESRGRFKAFGHAQQSGRIK